MLKRIQHLGYLLIALCAILIGVFVAVRYHSRPVPLKEATVFTHPKTLAPFQLTGIDGQPFTQKNLKGHLA